MIVMNKLIFRLPVLTLLLLFILVPCAWGQKRASHSALVIRTQGTVLVCRYQSEEWLVAKPGTNIFQQDKIKVLSESEADLFVQDFAVVRLKENSQLDLSGIQTEIKKPASSAKVALLEKSSDTRKRTLLNLLKGKILLWVQSIKDGSLFEVHTAIGVAGVRGTRFTVAIPDQDTTIVAVFEGSVEVNNIELPDWITLIQENEVVSIRRGEHPSKPRKVGPAEQGDLQETLQLQPSNDDEMLEMMEMLEDKVDAMHLDSSPSMDTMEDLRTMPSSPMTPNLIDTMPGSPMAPGGMGGGGPHR